MPEPSLRYVLLSIHGDMRTSRTEYIMGRNSRSESRDCRGYCDGDPNQPGAIQYRYGPLRALIENRDVHYGFHLDLESEVYTAWRINEYGSPGWVKPKGRPPQRSGATVHVHTETIDTGERREILGYSARRVIIRTTRRLSSEDNGCTNDIEVDGWYIDPPAAWLALHPPKWGHAIFLAAVNGQIPTPVFTDVGPRETGFPLLTTRTHRSSFTDAEGSIRNHTSEDREEVTEFSEETLDSDLFVPPHGFQRVSCLPGERPLPFARRMRLGWENIKGRLRGQLLTLFA